MSKTICSWPACTCPHSGRGDAVCIAEENKHGKQLSFGERVTLEDGIDHAAQAKDEGSRWVDLAFAIVMLLIIVIGAIACGLYFAVKNTHTLPVTDFASRHVNVELNGKDTVRVTITDKFIYHYQTLTDEQKQELKEEIE